MFLLGKVAPVVKWYFGEIRAGLEVSIVFADNLAPFGAVASSDIV